MIYRSERVFIMAALLAAGTAVIAALGRGLEAEGSLVLLAPVMSLALVVLAGLGALWVTPPSVSGDSGALALPRLPLVRLPAQVVLPGLMAFGFSLFVLLFDDVAAQAVVVVLAGLSFGGVYWALVHAPRVDDPRLALAQTSLNVGAHLTAFLVFSVLYGLKAPALVSAGAVGLATALLLYELLTRESAWHEAAGRPGEQRKARPGVFALAAGLVVAELTWGLNYWAALSTLVGGAFLLLVFYVIHGLIASYLDRQLSRAVLGEFGAVSVIGLAVIFASAFLS